MCKLYLHKDGQRNWVSYSEKFYKRVLMSRHKTVYLHQAIISYLGNQDSPEVNWKEGPSSGHVLGQVDYWVEIHSIAILFMLGDLYDPGEAMWNKSAFYLLPSHRPTLNLSVFQPYVFPHFKFFSCVSHLLLHLTGVYFWDSTFQKR